jgi:hypothetical protein
MTEAEKVAKEFMDQVVSQSRANLKANGNNSSGQLSRSIKGVLKGTDIEFFMKFYGTGIDAGRRGTKSTRSRGTINKSIFNVNRPGRPPASAILQWIKIKPVEVSNKEPITSIAFKMAKSIGEKGWKANQFFSKPFTQDFEEFPDDYIEAYGIDIEIILEDIKI